MEQPSTILIVDDDRVTRQILRGLLEPEGHVIATAGDGDSALERARELMPDLVLLDVLMPGLDGYEVCRRLRADAQLAEVPIIMLTALDDRASRLIGMEAGADDFVSKPFDRVELLTRLRSITRLNRFRRLLQERSQLQRAEREVLRRVRELELLNETITRTAATLDVREVFQLGCDALARAFAPALACGLQLDPAEARLSLVASAESSETGRALRMPRAIPEAGLSVGELSYGARLLGSQSPFAVAEPAFALRFAAVDPVPLETETPTSLVLPILTRDQLGEPLRLMLRDAPMPESMQLADLIERVRILCTVYDPETGTYRYDYALFIEIAGGLTFALAMAWFFLDEWRNRRRRQRKAERAMRALDGTPG